MNILYKKLLPVSLITALVLLLTTLLFMYTANAHDAFHVNKINICQVSKIHMNDYEPENFNPGNNLVRVAGDEALYCGEKVIVTGKLVDHNCVPVADAKIYMWQVGCDGKYPYTALKGKIVDKSLINEESKLSFVGNGIATTDNLGRFHFITTYPAAAHELPPLVNIRVEHHKLGSLQTKIILKKHKVKYPLANPELSTVSNYARNHNISIYNAQITIPGEVNKDY